MRDTDHPPGQGPFVGSPVRRDPRSNGRADTDLEKLSRARLPGIGAMRRWLARSATCSLLGLLACTAPPGERVEEEWMPSSPELRRALDAHRWTIVGGNASGEVWAEPASFEAGEVVTYRVHYRVGPPGIQPGGGLLLEYPKEWLSMGPPLPKPVRLEKEGAPHSIFAETSAPDVRFLLTADQEGLAGTEERFPRTVTVFVDGAPVEEGEVITVSFGPTTAPFAATAGAVRLAVDPWGLGEYSWVDGGAGYEVRSGPPLHLRLIAPSQAVAGQPSSMTLVALDEYFNPVPDLNGAVEVSGLAEEPFDVSWDADAAGAVSFTWTPAAPGFVWPQATARLTDAPRREEAVFTANGNPVRVSDGEPAESVYWGDLQSHSGVSMDAIGRSDFEYARDVSRLDFYATTEHAHDGRSWRRALLQKNGLSPRDWSRVRRRARDFHAPGRFVTILGYEASLPVGHRCVFFRGEDGIPWASVQVGHRVENLWRRLKPGQALTIAHHLGRTTTVKVGRVTGPGLGDVRYVTDKGGFWGPVVDWSTRGAPGLEPALEIYSAHGTSEMYDPEDTLAYERVGYLPSISANGPHYARDAWAAGHRLGTVAGSDNHTGQPGLAHFGLTAVRVSELSRDNVLDAILDRRSYATTGERILLEFQIAEAPMGGVVSVRQASQGSVLAVAPREIRYAEVMRLVRATGEWSVAKRWESPGRLLEAAFEVPSVDEQAVYYLRVELEGVTFGRVARAWSSPIWIDSR